MDAKECQDQVAAIARTVVANEATTTDRDSRWPEKGLRALQAAGLGGLMVPRAQGGQGGGLSDLLAACTELGRFCGSTAICFGMHCVGTAVIAAKATRDQCERYRRKYAHTGRTLAQSSIVQHRSTRPGRSMSRGGMRIMPRSSWTRAKGCTTCQWAAPAPRYPSTAGALVAVDHNGVVGKTDGGSGARQASHIDGLRERLGCAAGWSRRGGADPHHHIRPGDGG